MQIVELRSGARVRVCPVPPHILLCFRSQIYARHMEGVGDAPEVPTVDIEMKAGNVETLPIGIGSPGWDEYAAALEVYQAARDDASKKANTEWVSFNRDYAVEAWSWDGETWLEDVPDDWQPKAAIARAGIELSGNRRVDYINLVLCRAWEDYEALTTVAEQDIQGVSDEEVMSILDGFRTGIGRQGNAPPETPGHGRVRKWILHGNGDGAVKESLARRLVQRITRRSGSDDRRRAGAGNHITL